MEHISKEVDKIMLRLVYRERERLEDMIDEDFDRELSLKIDNINQYIETLGGRHE